MEYVTKATGHVPKWICGEPDHCGTVLCFQQLRQKASTQRFSGTRGLFEIISPSGPEPPTVMNEHRAK